MLYILLKVITLCIFWTMVLNCGYDRTVKRKHLYCGKTRVLMKSIYIAAAILFCNCYIVTAIAVAEEI
jgi:uncharacterized membrane protein